MRSAFSYFFTTCVTISSLHLTQGYADDMAPQTNPEKPLVSASAPERPFAPFTGKITRNKVRIRIQPNLDSPIVKELERNAMVIVLGEVEDFYAIQPPPDMKAFVYRTFVLDNTIEGNRVNVRTEPDLESPVLVQLNNGDRIEGNISAINSKWYEIVPPAKSRLYISKEFIENVGDPSVMTRIAKRRDEVERILDSTFLVTQSEMQKPFPQIQLEGIVENLNHVINNYSDFPEEVDRAKTMLTMAQEGYTIKKIAYLEARSQVAEKWQAKNSQLTAEIQQQQNRLNELESKLKTTPIADSSDENHLMTSPNEPNPSFINHKMTAWVPAEVSLYTSWKEQHPNQTMDEFYQQQALTSTHLKGVIEPYNRIIKNKPGDYILINPANQLPIAYLYSTRSDLESRVGQEVTLEVIPRPNNHFAFPAYYVLSIE